MSIKKTINSILEEKFSKNEKVQNIMINFTDETTIKNENKTTYKIPYTGDLYLFKNILYESTNHPTFITIELNYVAHTIEESHSFASNFQSNNNHPTEKQNRDQKISEYITELNQKIHNHNNKIASH